MAKANQQTSSTETSFSCSLTVPNKHLPLLRKSAEDTDEPLGQRVASIAEGAVLDLCEGGLMLNAPAMRKMSEAFGKRPEVGDVVEKFSKGAGRVDGKMQITVSIPPEMESVIEAAAEFQGVSVEQCLNDLWNTAWDNGDFYDWRPFVKRVLMRNEDHAALVGLLGKNFDTGTELADLVKKHLAEHASPFEEVER